MSPFLPRAFAAGTNLTCPLNNNIDNYFLLVFCFDIVARWRAQVLLLQTSIKTWTAGKIVLADVHILCVQSVVIGRIRAAQSFIIDAQRPGAQTNILKQNDRDVSFKGP